MATIIFKPTERCNANCVYCDVITKEDRAPDMSYELLELVFKRINDYLLDSSPNERVVLTWHGGEPTLLGAEYFRKAKEIQERVCPETGGRIQHIIQSNLTMLTQEVIDALKDLGIRNMGSSFDPEPGVRGIGWVEGKPNTAHYNKLFLRGTRLLEKNHMDWGFIYVVNRHSLEDPLGIFYHLANLRLGGGFMLNPVLVYHEDSASVAISAEEYAHFLGTIFEEWWKHRDRYPEVQPFRSLVKQVVHYERVTGCQDSGMCADHYLYIGPDGHTSHCGRSGDWKIGTYGNINDKTFQEIFADEHRDFLKKRVEHLKENDCKDCRFWELCHGGCPLDAYQANKGDYMHKTPWCEFKKVFIEQYLEPITGAKFDPEVYRAKEREREEERRRGRRPDPKDKKEEKRNKPEKKEAIKK